MAKTSPVCKGWHSEKSGSGPFIPSDKRLDSLAIEGLQGMSFLLVRECNRNSLHFFGVRSFIKGHGFPEHGIDSMLRASLPPIKGTNSKDWVPNKEGKCVAFP